MHTCPVIKEYDLKTVQDYMYHIRDNAEQSVRHLLREVVKRLGTNILEATDYMDDGSPVSRSQIPPFLPPGSQCLSDTYSDRHQRVRGLSGG